MKKFLIIAALFAASIFAVNEITNININENGIKTSPAASLEESGISSYITEIDSAEEPEENGIFNDVLDFVIHIFIPRETFWEEKFNGLSDGLRERLPYQTYVDTVGGLREISSGLDGDFQIPSIIDYTEDHIHLHNVFQTIGPHLAPFRILITGIYIVLIAYYNYRQFMFMIRGTNYSGINNTLNNVGSSS